MGRFFKTALGEKPIRGMQKELVMLDDESGWGETQGGDKMKFFNTTFKGYLNETHSGKTANGKWYVEWNLLSGHEQALIHVGLQLPTPKEKTFFISLSILWISIFWLEIHKYDRGPSVPLFCMDEDQVGLSRSDKTYCSCNEPCFCLTAKPWKKDSSGAWVPDEDRMKGEV